MIKLVSEQSEWGKVAKELESEDFKLMSYDKTLLDLLCDVKNVKVLDFGSGPGVLAKTLQELGAEVKTFDVSEDMNKLAADKIGSKNVFHSAEEIDTDYFNIVIANLVVCIIEKEEVVKAMKEIHRVLRDGGTAWIGFCNPRIFNVSESQLDLREQTEHTYEENHSYKKTKKEGGYEIIETHRPIEWYDQLFKETGFRVKDTHFTPEYELKGKNIQDFVIFELVK